MHEGENYSVEHLRRALNIGYKKAKRIFDEMEGKMAKTSTDDDYTGKAAPTPKVPHSLFPQSSVDEASPGSICAHAEERKEIGIKWRAGSGHSIAS